MYSGSTFVVLKRFDAWFGAHQKIDRVAYKHLLRTLPVPAPFPAIREILRFEGMDGPDGIKRKNPAKDEPWHFYNPYDPYDDKLITIITEHYQQLVQALRTQNRIRAAFEAAWLAHAIVDGLTPAHHYPYEAELIKLRGEGIETRTSLKDKLLLPGDTLSKQVQNNWKMWGDKGLLATHFAFEWGICAMITPFRFRQSMPLTDDIKELQSAGLATVFRTRAKQIADLHMYDKFYASGWTPKLAKQVRRELIPLIINAVTLAWYGAVMESVQESKA